MFPYVMIQVMPSWQEQRRTDVGPSQATQSENSQCPPAPSLY